MLNPSIDSLLEKIDSKYSLVSIAAKRARALQGPNSYSPLENPISCKSVGRALEEIDAEMLKFEREE